MFKHLYISISAGMLALFLGTACAEEAADGARTNALKPSVKSDKQDVSIMHQPVDFSSPEAVEKTLQDIREKEGDQAYRQLKNAMQYISVYDLSVSKNEEKLYRKLNGRTPEQIIAKMKR